MKLRRMTAILTPFSLIHSVAESFQSSQLPSKIHPPTYIFTVSNVNEYENSDLTTSRRRSILVASFGFAACFLQCNHAQAKYGESTNIEMPNYIEYLIEKNSSLDTGKILYKGADPTILLQRLQEANKRLGDIPILAEEKKWSQIQGTITGPLGTLAQTINQIATPDSSSKVKDASKKVKSDVIAIGQAAAKKNAAGCAEMSRLASSDLESFVKLAFE